MREEVVNLNGGRKQFWLRTHRKEVEAYYIQHGPEATMLEFNLSSVTLERFLSNKNRDIRLDKLSQADRWVLRMAMESDRDLQRRIARLEEWQLEAAPIIEFGQALIDATSEKIRIRLTPPALPGDPLKLGDIERSEPEQR